MARPFATFVALAVLVCASSAGAKPPDSTTLPLKRLRLYETGVGYFERSGRVDGAKGALSLPVPAGHLDDALKTLVVLSPDGQATVQGLEFRSSASRPLALALAGLPPSADGAMSYPALLRSLKGASVEVRTERDALRGRIVDVLEPATADSGPCANASEVANRTAAGASSPGADAWLAHCADAASVTVLLLGDNAEIRRPSSREIRSVRPTDPAFQARLGTALDTLSQRGAQTRRDLELQATAGKLVTIGYVAEAPLWRSTYRIVLDARADSAVIQGWALLHNDTDEDWHTVHVELVNGQPDSFLFPLAAPRYARRELRTPDRQLPTVPQLLDMTVDNMWLGADEIGEAYGAAGLGLSGVGEGGGGRGEGIGLGSIGTIGHGAGMGSGSSASDLLSVGNLAPTEQAEGVEAGALFRYELPAPVDLRAHGSALLPFVRGTVKARRIALFSAPGETARSAVHIDNDTGQTLPAGPVSIFADGGFAGEAAMSRTKPKESRIVQFGADLDVELTLQNEVTTDSPRVLRFGPSGLTEHYIHRHQQTYELVNRSSSGRTVYLRLPFVSNSELSGADGTAFDTESSTAHAVLKAEPRQRATREIDVREGLERGHPLAELSAARLEQLAAADTLPAAQRGLLREAAARLHAADALRASLNATLSEREQVAEQLGRLRADIEAAGGKGIDGDDLVERMVGAEDKMEALRLKGEALAGDLKRERRRAYDELVKLNHA